MGGEGAMMQAIHSLRNNSRRSKREAFDGWSPSDKESQGIKIEPVSDQVLQEIRDKLKRQNHITNIKSIIAIAISFVLTVALVFYFASKP